MILKTSNIKANLKKLNLKSISYLLACFTVFYYPHTVFGGVMIDGMTIIETMIFSSFTLYAASKISSKETLLEPSSVSMAIAALFALVVMSSLFAMNKPLAVEAVFLFMAYAGCFYIFLALFKQEKHQRFIFNILVVVAISLSLYGLYAFNIINQRLEAVWRLRATFGNSNQMAGFLSMTIPVCIGLMLTKKFTKPVFTAMCVTLIILVVSLFFTYARGGWISTLIAASFILSFHVLSKKQHIKKNLGITAFLFLILCLSFLSSTDLVKRFNTMTQQDKEVSIYGRLLAWEGTIEMIKANPLNGVGPGNYSKAFTAFQPPGLTNSYILAHSDYLQFISETGVLLIPVMGWLIYSLFAHGFSKIKQAGQQTIGITLGAMGGIIAILIYSVSDFNLHIPGNALLFTVLVAIVAAPVGTQSGSGLPQIPPEKIP